MSTSNPEDSEEITVASYLKKRLESVGLKRLFTVAGNYTAPFLDTILEDEGSKIKVTGISNEICAGYAADGYARIQGKNGLGAVAVTYGVGAFSLLNAVAGAFVEQVPVIVINGAPTNREFATQRFAGLLYSHMMPDPLSNIEVYRPVTIAAERIRNAVEAPLQIDSALTACLTHSRPIYFEVMEDVWRATCRVPKSLSPILTTQSSITHSEVDDAVTQTIDLIKQYTGTGKAKPMFWAGAEIQRFGLQSTFESLLRTSGLQCTTSVLGKSLLSEDTEGFSAVGLPKNASCVIGLGAWTTSKDTGNSSIVGDRDKVIISQGNAFVGGAFFPNVSLEDFMKALQVKLQEESSPKSRKEVEVKSLTTRKGVLSDELWAAPIYPSSPLKLAKMAVKSSDPLDYDSFFSTLNGQWIKDSLDTTVVVDSSFPLIASQQGLHIKAPNGFVAQASWLSIGYAAPAAIGVKSAIDDNNLGDKRTVVIAGDGAFQETCQALSSYAHLRQNTVVFVLNNGIYGIEQKLVNPNPFRETPNDYSDKTVYSYNQLHSWNYEKLAEVFGMGAGYVVKTVGELESVIGIIRKETNKAFIIHVRLPQLSVPNALKSSLDDVGEDEWRNPEWPPQDIF